MNASRDLLLRELKLPTFLAQAQPLAMGASKTWGRGVKSEAHDPTAD
jgi:hypothetical protein